MAKLHNILHADWSLRYKVTEDMLFIVVELGLRIFFIAYKANTAENSACLQCHQHQLIDLQV